jgi:hypothetical protein
VRLYREYLRDFDKVRNGLHDRARSDADNRGIRLFSACGILT